MRILAVNAEAQAVNDTDMAAYMSGLTIPWLQDDAQENAWGTWVPTYRDVVIVDAGSRKLDVYNVTVNDLGNAANYAALKQKLLDAANAQ